MPTPRSADSRSLIINYQGRDDDAPRRREILVQDVEHTSAGNLVLKAVCLERRAVRHFRIDRITEAVDPSTGEVYQGPEAILDAAGWEVFDPFETSAPEPEASGRTHPHLPWDPRPTTLRSYINAALAIAIPIALMAVLQCSRQA